MLLEFTFLYRIIQIIPFYHRTQVIKTIRERLEAGLPCRVVSTQCIEAGVDLDFPVLYRALAPLEAIIQAAGRCNRNGRREGRVIVFEPEDERYPDCVYKNAAKQVKRMVDGDGVDIHNPADIDRYYRELLAQTKPKRELMQAIEKRDYAEVDRLYRLIPDAGEKVIVPYSARRTEYEELCRELCARGMTPSLMKKAASLTVTVYNRSDLDAYAEPIPLPPKQGERNVRSGYRLLRAQHLKLYTDEGGLRLPEKGNAALHSGFCY